MADSRLQYGTIEKSIMANDLMHNYEALLGMFGKLSFIAPTVSENNISVLGGEFYYYKNNENYKIKNGLTSLELAPKSNEDESNYNYTMKANGDSYRITEELKAEMGLNLSTHGMVYLLEVPRGDISKLSINENPVDASQIVTEGLRQYIVPIVGIYENEESEIVTELSTFNIYFENLKMTYEIDVSGLTLKGGFE